MTGRDDERTTTTGMGATRRRQHQHLAPRCQHPPHDHLSLETREVFFFLLTSSLASHCSRGGFFFFSFLFLERVMTHYLRRIRHPHSAMQHRRPASRAPARGWAYFFFCMYRSYKNSWYIGCRTGRSRLRTADGPLRTSSERSGLRFGKILNIIGPVRSSVRAHKGVKPGPDRTFKH